MASKEERASEDKALTMEELSSTNSFTPSRSKRNAFSELMSAKHKAARHSSASTTTTTTASPPLERSAPLLSTKPRSALGAYINKPESYPPSVVLYHTPVFVAIRDAYPKSTVHLLLLPRSTSITHLHPFDALSAGTPDLAAFLSSIRAEAATLKRIAASELRRLLGAHSRSDAAYQRALDADDPPPPAEMPPGRDWEAEVLVGVHARPSMAHMHLHVLSADRRSASVKHRKHYNSFATPFFVPLEDFPLAEGDPRREPTREGYLKRDLACWRCGRGFGSAFKRLKEHLEDEFEEWKKI